MGLHNRASFTMAVYIEAHTTCVKATIVSNAGFMVNTLEYTITVQYNAVHD